ncbi:MAG: hypothetical protein E7311_02730 [Clostridiales bacterium]|nr:hypothetical protein [Clostridiales bacterium]
MKKVSWNDGSSIRISELKEEQVKQAIKEWSEGSEALEKLLWNCYKNKVITTGCDSGNHNHFPYLRFLIDESAQENVKKILLATDNFAQSEILIKFGGNPHSGPDWYKSSISVKPIRKEDANVFFSKINCVLQKKENDINEYVELLLSLYDFFKDKLAGISIFIIKNKNTYSISFNSFLNKNNWDYYTKILSKAHLKLEKPKSPEDPFVCWKHTSEGKEEFILCLKKILEVLKENWSLKIPDKVTKDMSFNYSALVMQKKYGTDEKGIQLMNKWINSNKFEGMREVNY